ncbi:hypothetical protein [uncultured Thiodictyon sp.]|uniref:hypothetical protein n=1 Tax=uncultured Thiodictyon sp. TaxID=1846217 RepID=UPI0025F4311C|nr:hypothetical protein [uncultured Thiodictyon sp.]
MKRLICAVPLLCSVNSYAGGWIADSASGCQVWNGNPSPGESIKWSGPCSNKRANGNGVLQWLLNGKPNGRYEGEYRDGQQSGRGTYTWANGKRYEGEYRDGKRCPSEISCSAKEYPAGTWTSIGWEELYKLMSGNTLISQNKFFCADKNTNHECLAISILNSSDVKIDRIPATVIYPERKQVLSGEWGYYAANLMDMGLNAGFFTMVTDNRALPFASHVSINNKKDMFRAQYDGVDIVVKIKPGHDNKYVADAKKGDFQQVDARGRMTFGQAVMAKAVNGFVKAWNEGGTAGDLNNLAYSFHDWADGMYAVRIGSGDLKNLAYSLHDWVDGMYAHRIGSGDLKSLAYSFHDWADGMYASRIGSSDLKNLAYSLHDWVDGMYASRIESSDLKNLAYSLHKWTDGMYAHRIKG